MKQQTFILASLAAALAFAGAEGDSDLETTHAARIDIYNTSALPSRNPDGLYLTCGGFVTGSESTVPVSCDNNGNAVFRLVGAIYGMSVSEPMEDFDLGDWCTSLPIENGEAIDWVATGNRILASNAYSKEGRLLYNKSATNDLERVMFTRGGRVTIDWVLTSGVVRQRTYMVSWTTPNRPYRIFWTENGFKGPPVMLCDDNGQNSRHVRLFGDPKLVKPEYSVQVMQRDPYIATSNVVKGVVINEDSHMLQVYAKRGNDDIGNHDGPEGQFVLAYYSDGTKDKLVCTIVVEVAPPEVAELDANVGDELKPTGEGYSIDHITANIMAGSMDDSGDPASPYLYKHSGFTDFSPKNGCVFAIAPNDAANQASGVDSPQKADIWWESTDPMGTEWPFEHDQYLIKWGDNLPKVVTGGSDNPGCGILLPSVYDGKTSVEHYSTPANIASASTNIVTVTGAGKFLLRINAEDNIWFLPFQSVLNTDTNYYERTAGEWHIGDEIDPRFDSAAGAGAVLANAIDRGLPGYIYEAGSAGRNWNPHLYHAPHLKSAAEESQGTQATTDADPYDTLTSSIYAVNVSNSPIEVWWFASLQASDMPSDIIYPTSAQLYKAIWPLPEETHSIVLASQLGSAGDSLSATKTALYLANTNSTASASGLTLGSAEEGTTIGFWINPSPRAAEFEPVRAGRLLTIATDACDINVEASFRDLLIYSSSSASALLPFVEAFNVVIPSNNWTHVAISIAPDGLATVYLDDDKAGETIRTEISGETFATNSTAVVIGKYQSLSSCTGVGLDHLAIWPFALSQDDVRAYVAGSTNDTVNRMRHSWTFDNQGDLVHIQGIDSRFAIDSASGATITAEKCLALGPGGPSRTSGTISAVDGVVPRIYYENDSAAVGYNPNEEHAFVRAGEDEYTVWALRCDLNTTNSSEPFVLVEYNDNGKGAMKVFDVSLIDDVYTNLSSSVTVGNLLYGPHPLDFIDGYYNTKNYCLEPSTDKDSYVVYRDRHNRMWARRDGFTYQFNYYPVQEGFWFPSLDAGKQPDVGTLVGWMSCTSIPNPKLAEITDAAPEPWMWHATWPPADKIPSMRIGQTLTTADAGLPEVWNALSMAVVYPVPESDQLNANKTDTVVTLIDPTVAQTAPLAIESNFATEYSFTVGPAGNCQLRSGKYYFTGLPPNISDRFYIDTNAAEENRMVLVGKMVSKKAGTSYLQINTLSASERQALKDICKATGAAKTAWDNGVDALATEQVEPSKRHIENLSVAVDTTSTGAVNRVTRRVAVNYEPKDHYALVATGHGTNYVTLIENDSPNESMVPVGSTISMHVLKVIPELYTGSLVVLQDPNNKLSEQLNVLYTAPLGDASDSYTFEWRKREPAANGVVPEVGEVGWGLKTSGVGVTSILLGGGGANLTELVNTYYEMRYKPVKDTAAYGIIGDRWSGWCGPTLAEGWVQRVLNNVTPFAQRMSDFYTNASEINYTMPEQIGGPYRGDVALNDSNLENVGLIELYQTVLNKAESLSLSLDINDINANKQLMEAVSRLADLYTLLGDDAYSDAVNPTIETLSIDNFIIDYDAFPASTYCFANQVPSLLDEELALLRGRSAAVAPNMTTYPYYNRLMWNFTKGITQGEMAYVQNYGINGGDGEITAEQAAAQYPMGHGDAYGHYLSAIWGYYRLLRNPNFDWGEPGMMEMLVADSIVNMDYEDEQKFAMAAAKMAQTGADVVDLTARKTWRDQNGDTQAGYFDGNADQGFGYGEWGVRTGLGALYNWATVNSLLPTNETASAFADNSISDVTRMTVPALDLLAENFAAVDRKVNMIDAGLNPLGLSDNAIPFDIDPVKLEAGESHFDQILERAERALDNAKTVLDYANKFGARLRQITASVANDGDGQEEFEKTFNSQLIAIYGTPYPEDIGPSGTYPQGYTGPDLYHYNYIDIAPYGLESLDTDFSKTYTIYAEKSNKINDRVGYMGDYTITVAYNVTSGGVLVKPASWNGVRRCEGSVQAAYRDYLAAYVELSQALIVYSDSIDDMKDYMTMIQGRWDNEDTKMHMQNAVSALHIADAAIQNGAEMAISVFETSEDVSEIVQRGTANSAPWIVAGFAVGSNAPFAIANGVGTAVHLGIKTAADIGTRIAKITQSASAFAVTTIEEALTMAIANMDRYEARAALHAEVSDLVGVTQEAAWGVQRAVGALSAAEAAYRAVVAEGEELLEQRELMRKHQSNTATARRYQDMFYRVQRNSALSKFATCFDVAQKYVWQLAKVYDYETGLLSSDKKAGDAFMREVVATRALGEKGVSVVADGTDGGLWDVVTRMKGNWENLKGRLGVNNPEKTAKWFSLRYSLFRIDPGADGDAAWRQELAKYVVDDIFADPEVARYCQRPQVKEGEIQQPEPGIVIPFSTTINLAENFFGKPLIGGETTFSSTDYAVKINSVGLDFSGYDALAVTGPSGLAAEPNVYLVPVGFDYMRTPAGTSRKTLSFSVIDQILPLPYTVGSTELDDADWLATFSGLDGTADSTATIRRHSTMAVGQENSSSRLVGRSVWNDRWLLVIPASSLSSDRARAIWTFINGLDSDSDGAIDIPGVADIRLGIRAYSRNGN